MNPLTKQYSSALFGMDVYTKKPEVFLNKTFKIAIFIYSRLFLIIGHSVMLGFEIYDKPPKQGQLDKWK